LSRDLTQRFTYHAPNPDQIERYQALRTLARELAESIDELCPDSDEKNNALDAVDEAIMWGNASIARHSDD
jgi:hypothetical protein